jgi:cytochrome-b5 reductase
LQWFHFSLTPLGQISGGTGCTPFVQYLNGFINSGRNSQTKFTWLHSSHVEELPPASIMSPLILYSLSHPHRLRMQMFVNHMDILPEYLISSEVKDLVREGRIDGRAIHEAVHGQSKLVDWFFTKPPMKKRTLFLLCGPETYRDNFFLCHPRLTVW